MFIPATAQTQETGRSKSRQLGRRVSYNTSSKYFTAILQKFSIMRTCTGARYRVDFPVAHLSFRRPRHPAIDPAIV